MSYILAPNKEMLTPLFTVRFAYARTGFTYAHILSYAELTLAYAHHSFSLRYTTPLQGAPLLHEHKGLERGSNGNGKLPVSTGKLGRMKCADGFCIAMLELRGLWLPDWILEIQHIQATWRWMCATIPPYT